MQDWDNNEVIDAIHELSDIRAGYNLFNPKQRPKYHACTLAIKALREVVPELDKPQKAAVVHDNPKKVVGKSYSNRDCETIARCPSCNKFVTNGMAGMDEVCPSCGQALEW